MNSTIRSLPAAWYRVGFALAVLATPAFAAKPIVIAHRGASGYLPEHTLPSAALAIGLGADYIEPDLVLSKDDVPVVLHDIHLEATTDVKSKFPDRKRPDGRWYAIDFTLAELKQLNVHERWEVGTEKPAFSKRFPAKTPTLQIPTFLDMLDLVQGLHVSMGREIGLYPEIKSPAFHRKEGKDISAIVLKIIRDYNLDRQEAPIFIQCFDAKELKRVRVELQAQAKLIQLIGENSWKESDTDYDALLTKPGLAEVKTYADGIGPAIKQLFSVRDNKKPLEPEPNQIVAWAHEQKLLVHPYTVRKDQLGPAKNLDLLHDALFRVLKVDGVFTDFTDLTRRYVDQMK